MDVGAQERRRVFHLGPRRKAVLIGVWILLLVPPVLAGWWEHDDAALLTGLITGGLLALVLAPTVWWFPRLVVAGDGVVRHNLGYRLACSWNAIDSLRLERGSEGFVLREPMRQAGARRFAAAAKLCTTPGGVALYPPEVMELIRDGRFLPLEAFAHWLRNGALLGEIGRHAPWLTEALPRTIESSGKETMR